MHFKQEEQFDANLCCKLPIYPYSSFRKCHTRDSYLNTHLN